MSPPFTKRRFVSLFEGGGDMGEVFLCLGRCEFVTACGFAPVLWVGGSAERHAGAPCGLRPCKARYLLEMICCRERPMCRSGLVAEYISMGYRFIPPHQSLVRQLPPKGKPSLRCANMVNTELSGKYSLCFCPFTLLRSTKRDFAKRLPLGGKLSRERLMRGDKFHPTVRFVCRIISEQTPFGLDGQWRKPESHFLKAVP